MRVLDPAVTRVFGREHEIDEVRRLLATAPGVVTVSGRGGIGKTSVALEVMRELGATEHRTWIPLAGVTEPDLVIDEIAHALDAPIDGNADALDVVAEVLGHGSWVLALDNVEQVLAFAPTLAALLDRCPELRVLVTSRAPLRLRAERVVALAPLPDPSDPTDTTLEQLREEPAVAIYCRRAAAVDRSFELTDQNAPAVVELCRRLEGLPLAIELAAARAAMLPAAEILRRLEGSALDVLHRPRADAPERHHGLRAAIDWSYRLLSDDEQWALRSLSVNVGTFDLDTAIALIDSGERQPTAGVALDALTTLVDFHLVDPVPASDPPRFTIPDSIRAFAREELDRHGETAEAERRRIRERARQARTVAEGSESCSSEGSMADDRDDLLDALRVAIDLGLADDALDLARGLGSHWDLRGYGPFQEQLLERALELGEQTGADPSRLANATLWSAYLGLRHASSLDHDELVVRIRRAEEQAASVGDDRAAFHAQSVWLLVTPITGDVIQAKAAVEEGLRLAERNRHDGWRATIEVWAGMLAQLSGDEQRAAQLGMSALKSARRRGDRETVVRAYMLLGPMAERLPDVVKGLPSVDEMIDMTHALGLTFYEALLMVRRAYNAVRAQDLTGAVLSMAESLDAVRALRDTEVVSFNLLVLVELAAARGDLDRAAYFSGYLRETLPAVEMYLGESQLTPYREALDQVRGALGDAEFESQAELGAALSGAQVVDEAAGYIGALREPSEVDLTGPAPASGQSAVHRLTPRQIEVLRLLAAGLSNKEIAVDLGLRAKTVMHHTTAIYRELGVRGRSEATAVAFRAGLVD